MIIVMQLQKCNASHSYTIISYYSTECIILSVPEASLVVMSGSTLIHKSHEIKVTFYKLEVFFFLILEAGMI